jgi:hypothetical protein
MASAITSYRLDNLEPALGSIVMHIKDNEWFRRVWVVQVSRPIMYRLSAGLIGPELGIADADMTLFSTTRPMTPAGTFFDRLKWLRCRQLFRTKKGKLGFRESGVKPGDVLCILDGSPVVHVLRRLRVAQDGEQIWQFVGDAYVHGLMAGEVDELSIDSTSIVLE